MRAWTLIVFMAFVVAGAPGRTNQAPRVETADWPTYDGSPSGNRFSRLDQITPATIHSLAPKWMFTIQAAPRTLQVTPIVVDGVVYVTSVN